MKLALLIVGIVEFLGGIVLLFYPQFLYVELDSNSVLHLIKMYAILAISFGAISIWLSRTFKHEAVFKSPYLMITAFQVFLCFHLYGMYVSNTIQHIGPIVLHGVLACVLVVFYLIDLDKY